jgi:hypothetical protein
MNYQQQPGGGPGSTQGGGTVESPPAQGVMAPGNSSSTAVSGQRQMPGQPPVPGQQLPPGQQPNQ